MDRLVCMEAFVRVAEAKSFAGAARHWGRSTTVVSKYIAQLEKHLGLMLLRRTTRSVALTEAGREHYETCRQLLERLAEAEAQLQACNTAPSGLLRISAPAGLLTMGEPPVLASFLKQHPGIELDIDVSQRMIDLIEDRIDVAIRVTEPKDSGLVARRLAPAPLILVASPAYLEAQGTPQDPSQLRNHQCLVDGDGLQNRWPLRVEGQTKTIEVQGPLRSNDLPTLMHAAAQGFGIALVPEAVVRPELHRGTLVEVLPGRIALSWSMWAVTVEGRRTPRRARALIDHLKERLPGIVENTP